MKKAHLLLGIGGVGPVAGCKGEDDAKAGGQRWKEHARKREDDRRVGKS